jgi:hypothetical protein
MDDGLNELDFCRSYPESDPGSLGSKEDENHAARYFKRQIGSLDFLPLVFLL